MGDASYVQSNPAIPAAPSLFLNHFAALVLIKKVIMLLEKFKFTFIQLKWLLEFRKIATNQLLPGWI